MSKEEKDQKIKKLERENTVLREKIAELERRLGINSETSSKPPSSDGLKAKKRTKSLREKGKRASGGQKGHLGQTLKQVEKPDYIINHYPVCKCGEQVEKLKIPKQVELVQVFLTLLTEAFTNHRSYRETGDRSLYDRWVLDFRERLKQALHTWRSQAGYAAGLLLTSLKKKSHQWWYFRLPS
jgi:hypothetical protein